MTSSLLVKFFFYNRTRTYRAVIILSVGIGIVFGTSMLTHGFYKEIESFSGSISRNNSKYYITNSTSPVDILDNYTFLKIIELLSNSKEIKSYIYRLKIPVEVMVDNSSISWKILEVTNITEYMNLYALRISTDFITDLPYFDVKLDYPTDINGIEYSFNSNIGEFKTNISMSFATVMQLNSDILIDVDSSVLPFTMRNKYNEIEFSFNEGINVDNFKEELEKITGISISSSRTDLLFLEISANQIGDILNLLQFGISAILTVSISNIILTIIYESENEIKIMKMIGFKKSKLALIYLGQSLLIGIFAFFISILITIVSLNIILSLLASTNKFPYLTIDIKSSEVLKTFIQTIMVTFFACIYPIYKVIIK